MNDTLLKMIDSIEIVTKSAIFNMVFLADPFNFLANWPSYVWLRPIPSCSPLGGLYKIPSVRKLINALTNAKNMLIFGDVATGTNGDFQLTFYPNRSNFRCCTNSGMFCKDNTGASDVNVPEPIRESAKEVILALKKEEDENNLGMERRLAAVENLLQKLIDKINN